MLNRLVACTVLSLAGVAAANAQVVQSINLTANTASPSVSTTSLTTVAPAPAYDWAISLYTVTATVNFGGEQPNPLYPGGQITTGTSGVGTANGSGVLTTLHFTGVDPITFASTPNSSTYDFTVTLELLANGQVKTTLSVTDFGLNNFYIATPPTDAIAVTGLAQVTPNYNVPAPAGAAALLGAGGMLSIRRRRPARA